MKQRNTAAPGRPSIMGFAGAVLLAALAGCATLPTSGPTGPGIRSQITEDASQFGLTLVRVKTVNDLPQPPAQSALFRTDYSPPPLTELVGPGDVLNVAIFETGIALFGRTAAIGTECNSNFDVASRAERFPPLRVSDQGTITIPYVGQVNVAGRTTREI